MDFEFSPDSLMLRDLLRRLIQRDVRPLEMKYFNTGSLAPEERQRLRQAFEQAGLWGLTVPEALGGGGLGAVDACLMAEELGRTFVPVETGEAPVVLYACDDDQAQRYLQPVLAGVRRAVVAAREPGALRPEAWQTTASPRSASGGADGDDCILEGRKLLASRPGAEDFLIVFARHPAGPTAFLMDSDMQGVELVNHGAPAVRLHACRVPGASRLGQPGGALRLGADHAPRAWIRQGARYVGLAERMIEMAAEHARDWVALGAPLAARPAVQRWLAEMRVDAEAARWLVYHAAWLADRGQAEAEAARQAAMQVRLATVEMLQRVIDRATLIYTGPGPASPDDPGRLARSAVPAEALRFTLEHARAAVAGLMLGEARGR